MSNRFRPGAELLEGRAVPAALTPTGALPASPEPLFAVGADSGGAPHVRVFTGSGRELYSFYAFDPAFLGGVRVATADFTGDGFEDVAVGAGPGAPGGHVKVWDGRTGEELLSFFAFDGFVGGVFLGTGDVTADGTVDLLVGAGPGGPPHVKVYDGATGTEARSFIAGNPALRGGVYVAGGDVTGDGAADIAVATGRFNPQFIDIYDGRTLQLVRSFRGYDETKSDDVDFEDLGPFALDAARQSGAPQYRRIVEGIYLATMADLDGDGALDLPTGRVLGEDPEVRVFGTREDDGEGEERDVSFDGGDDDDDVYGARPIGKDLNGDGRAELIVGAGPGSSQVVVYDGRSGDELYRFDAFAGFAGGVTVG